MMAGRPIKRIYFDSNWLHKWPFIANNLASLFRAANWMNTELYIPQTVEDELEEQFIRDLEASYGNTATGVKQLQRLCRDVIDLEFHIPKPAERDFREVFRARSQQIKNHFRISNIPLSQLTTGFLVEMAIRRKPPFEERKFDKDKGGVVGLQDTVILYSVIEHLKSKKDDERNAFVSNDGTFHRPGIKEVVEKSGVTLELYKDVSDVWKDMFDHIWENIRTEWDAENEQIKLYLNENKDALVPQILSLLPVSELVAGYRSVKEVRKLKVVEFSYAISTLPASNNRPPASPQYQRPNGSAVQISAGASVQVDVRAERLSFLDMLLNATPNQSTEPPPPRLEETTLVASLKLSITGTVHDGAVTNFQITDVQIEK